MRTMIWIGLLSMSSIPYLEAEEKQPTSFGKAGYVTDDQLAKLTYAPAVKDLALGVHMPKVSAPAGEPLWAYFVVKNVSDKVQGLDMRFDFVTGRTRGFINACSFAVETIELVPDDAKLTPVLRSQTWQCGNGPLVDVADKGYYVAAIDLAAWGMLGAGVYEVSWRYSRDHRSNVVRFKVLPGKGHVAEPPSRQWNIWELRTGGAKGKIIRAQQAPHENWGRTIMCSWWNGDLSASLGSGVGERHVTNLEALPSGDKLLRVSADWKLGDKVDRVTLRLSATDPKIRVSLDKFHLYLLADRPDGRGDEGFADRVLEGERIIARPYEIEFQLPSDWRTRTGDDKPGDKFQAAFLLTSTPLRKPRRGREIVKEQTDILRSKNLDPPQVWKGLLKTGFHELPVR